MGRSLSGSDVKVMVALQEFGSILTLSSERL